MDSHHPSHLSVMAPPLFTPQTSYIAIVVAVALVLDDQCKSTSFSAQRCMCDLLLPSCGGVLPIPQPVTSIVQHGSHLATLAVGSFPPSGDVPPFPFCLYSHVLHNDISANDGPHTRIRQWLVPSEEPLRKFTVKGLQKLLQTSTRSFKSLKTWTPTWIPNTKRFSFIEKTVHGALSAYKQIYDEKKKTKQANHHRHISGKSDTSARKASSRSFRSFQKKAV